MLTAFLLGAGLGAFVAAQIGPVSLPLVRSSLRHGAPVGLAIGAGAALVDTLYASLGVAGVAPLLAVSWLQLGLGLVGGVVLVVIGGRTLWSAWRVRLGGESADEVGSRRRAFLTAVARQRVRGAWLVAVDVVSGLGLVVFGGALGVRTLQDV